MQNSKFIQLLKTLHKKELKAFDKYLVKLYEEHEMAVALFQYFKSFYPDFVGNKLDLDYITSKVFKLQEDKTKRISNEASKLFSWLEEFLMLEKIKSEPNHYATQKFMIDIYKERRLDQFYFRKIESAREKTRENSKALWREFELMQLNHAYYYHPFTEKLNTDEKALEAAVTQANTFFTIITLKYQCELCSRDAILSLGSAGVPAYKVPDAPQKMDPLFQTLFQLYAAAYQLISTKEDTHYHYLKTHLFQSGEILDQEDHFIILNCMIIYVAKLIRRGDEYALKESFELYKYGIEKDLLAVGGFITETRFQNVVNIACELKEFTWINTFVEKNKTLLLTTWNEFSIQLAEARILFGKKNFREALQLLRTMNTNHKAFNLNTKIIEIQCFFEIGEEFYDMLESGIKAFDMQLIRNKTLNPAITEGARNFLTILKLVISGKYTQEALQEKLHSQVLIVGKYWLEEKIRELPSDKKQLRV